MDEQSQSEEETDSDSDEDVPLHPALASAPSGARKTLRKRPVKHAVAARDTTNGESVEEAEREMGNQHFKKGDFPAAIKNYTRCLGINPTNVLALSNRAMAYLKIKEFRKAEVDCSNALKHNAEHVKSWVRRGAARNALGRHHHALLDFQTAHALDATNRGIKGDMLKTREAMKNAIRRSPRTKMQIEVVSTVSRPAGPVMPEVQILTPHALKDEKSMAEAKGAAAPAKQSQASASKAKSSKSNAPKKVLKTPKTGYEFQKTWGGLDIDERREYLLLINPQQIKKVIGDSLDAETLNAIVTVIHETFLPYVPRVKFFAL